MVGEENWISVPAWPLSGTARISRLAAAALAGFLFVGFALALLARSEAKAAVPFAFVYSAIAVVTVTAIAGRSSEWMTRLSLLAMISLPASLAHLSLTFPRERQVIRDAPDLQRVPYFLTAILIPAGWFALDSNPLLWPTFVLLLLALSGGAWFVLVASCLQLLQTMKEKIHHLEKQ